MINRENLKIADIDPKDIARKIDEIAGKRTSAIFKIKQSHSQPGAGKI